MSPAPEDSAERLLSIIDRVERIDEDIAGLNADKKEIYAEAKCTGFDVKILKALISERRKDSSDLAEYNDLLDTYRDAIRRAEASRGKPRVQAHVRTRETPAQTITPHDPSTGEIIEQASGKSFVAAWTEVIEQNAASPGASVIETGTGAAAESCGVPDERDSEPTIAAQSATVSERQEGLAATQAATPHVDNQSGPQDNHSQDINGGGNDERSVIPPSESQSTIDTKLARSSVGVAPVVPVQSHTTIDRKPLTPFYPDPANKRVFNPGPVDPIPEQFRRATVQQTGTA